MPSGKARNYPKGQALQSFRKNHALVDTDYPTAYSFSQALNARELFQSTKQRRIMPEIRHEWRNRMQNRIRKTPFLWMAIVAISLVAVIWGGYWLFRDHSKEALPSAPSQSLPKMANMPNKKPEIKPPPKPTYAPDAPVIEQARQALREGITPADALAMAATLPEKPERADAAFLLLEYAAESGNAEAAMAVGEYYDPSLDLPSGSIRKDAAHAFEWYQISLSDGHTESGNRLTNLRRWVVARAENGSADAQALLKTWP